MKAIFAGGLCLALGLGVGYLRAASTTPESPARIEPAPAVGAMQPRADVHVVHREIVREGRLEPAKAEAPVDEPRVERARLVVERAKARGAWTDRDRDLLRDEMDGLAGPIKAEIAEAFSDAVNRGELRIETDAPL